MTVTEADGHETWSDSVKLTVDHPPRVYLDPTPLFVPFGKELTITASVWSDLPVSYQWFRNNQAIPNATNAIYAVASMGTSDVGDYALNVMSDAGTGTSLRKSVRTDSPLVFTRPPQSQRISLGQDVRLMASVFGTRPTRVQWFHDGQPVSGNSESLNAYEWTENVLSIPHVQQADLGAYYVEFENAVGIFRSPTATVEEGARPTIVCNSGFTAYAGDIAVLSVQVDLPGPFGYAWYFNGNLISQKAMLSVDAQPSAAGEYRVEISTVDWTASSDSVHLSIDTSYDSWLRMSVAFRSCTSAIFPLVRYQTGGGAERFRIYRDGIVIHEFGLRIGYQLVTGIPPGVAAQYWVAQMDADGHETKRSPPITVTPPDCIDMTPPTVPKISWVTVSCDRVKVYWSESTDNTAVRQYRLYRDDQMVSTWGSSVYEFTGLTPGQSYTLGVAALDYAGNESPKDVRQIKTPLCPNDGPPNTPYSFTVLAIDCTQVYTAWGIPSAGSPVDHYRLMVNGEPFLVPANQFQFRLTAIPNTRYSITLSAVGLDGQQSTPTVESTVFVPSCADSAPPRAPGGLSARSNGCESIQLFWTAAVDIGSAGLRGYNIYRNGALLQFHPVPTSPTYADRAVTLGVRYAYEVSSVDNNGKESAKSEKLEFQLDECPDVSPPLAVNNVRITAIACDHVEIHWQGTTDTGGSGLRGYRVFRDSTLLAETGADGRFVIDSGLQANTKLSYSIFAVDNAGNQSSPSWTSATTPPCPDLTPPEIPKDLVVNELACRAVTIAWTAVRDVGKAGLQRYIIYRDGNRVGDVGAGQTFYTDFDLQATAHYVYTVAARDSAGNLSSTGQALEVNTPKCWEPVGQVLLANRVGLEIDAPITLPDGTGPGKLGLAQLCLLNSDGSLTELSPVTTFRTNSLLAAKYLNPVTIDCPDVTPGTKVTMKIRAWIGTSYDTADFRGESENITVVLGGGIVPPPNLDGFHAFVLRKSRSSAVQPVSCAAGPSALVLQFADGKMEAWSISNRNVNRSAIWGTKPDSCRLLGMGDFNHDGQRDLLLETDDDGIAVWLMVRDVLATVVPMGKVPKNWKIIGVGDFDGDGNSDVLLEHSDRTLAFWFMERTDIREGVLSLRVPSGWQIVGVSDFDGDGKSDIVLFDEERAIAFWMMDRSEIRLGRAPFSLERDWQIVGVGDLDGNGKSDIAFRHADGSLALWSMDELTIEQAFVFGQMPADGGIGADPVISK